MRKYSEKQAKSKYGLRPLISPRGLPKGVLINKDGVIIRVKENCPDRIEKYFAIRGRGVVSAFYSAVNHLRVTVGLTDIEMITMTRTFREWVEHHEDRLRNINWL